MCFTAWIIYERGMANHVFLKKIKTPADSFINHNVQNVQK